MTDQPTPESKPTRAIRITAICLIVFVTLVILYFGTAGVVIGFLHGSSHHLKFTFDPSLDDLPAVYIPVRWSCQHCRWYAEFVIWQRDEAWTFYFGKKW